MQGDQRTTSTIHTEYDDSVYTAAVSSGPDTQVVR